ncbi:MAG TPA: transglutaminase domain-containing protein [Ramlibacter sp.]|nr:transglutaminase domain-containing protein [Ramlibacter sp.]
MNSRRDFLKSSSALPLAATIPCFFHAGAVGAASSPQRSFDPRPQDGWRTFEVTTRVDIDPARGATQVWLPVPTLVTDWQRPVSNLVSSNGSVHMIEGGTNSAAILHARFTPAQDQPVIKLISRVQTRDRALDWSQPRGAKTEPDASLAQWTQSTALIPTYGIVRSTAQQAIRGTRDDVDKARAIYDWVVRNTHHEPAVRGCGEGDVKAMLESGNLSGKCADQNALFVGMCRSVGIPARDLYGVRLAASRFGYRELGGDPAALSAAQHCRAEAWLRGYGWVAMDPADVTKVMRDETTEWIRDPGHALVAPVHKGLFGCCEGNWLAYNAAHDVVLPSAIGPRLGFLMHPVAETAKGRLDSYAPDDFRYRITAREIKA